MKEYYVALKERAKYGNCPFSYTYRWEKITAKSLTAAKRRATKRFRFTAEANFEAGIEIHLIDVSQILHLIEGVCDSRFVAIGYLDSLPVHVKKRPGGRWGFEAEPSVSHLKGIERQLPTEEVRRIIRTISPGSSGCIDFERRRLYSYAGDKDTHLIIKGGARRCVLKVCHAEEGKIVSNIYTEAINGFLQEAGVDFTLADVPQGGKRCAIINRPKKKVNWDEYLDFKNSLEKLKNYLEEDKEYSNGFKEGEGFLECGYWGSGEAYTVLRTGEGEGGLSLGAFHPNGWDWYIKGEIGVDLGIDKRVVELLKQYNINIIKWI